MSEEVVWGRLELFGPDDEPPDLATIDALARLQLETQRRGGGIRFTAATNELEDLLDLAGLRDVFAGGGRLRQVVGQPEQREQLVGIEEGVEPPDLPA